MVQRRQYRFMMENKPSSMKQERIVILNGLGFAWSVLEMAWYQKLQSFKSYREEYGHSNVPVNCTKYPKLYLWIREQRNQYALMKRGKKSNMTPSRLEVLDSIGFCWDYCEAQRASRLQGLQELVASKEMYGHFQIPGAPVRVVSGSESSAKNTL
jgi:hypothetical protein